MNPILWRRDSAYSRALGPIWVGKANMCTRGGKCVNSAVGNAVGWTIVIISIMIAVINRLDWSAKVACDVLKLHGKRGYR